MHHYCNKIIRSQSQAYLKDHKIYPNCCTGEIVSALWLCAHQCHTYSSRSLTDTIYVNIVQLHVCCLFLLNISYTLVSKAFLYHLSKLMHCRTLRFWRFKQTSHIVKGRSGVKMVFCRVNCNRCSLMLTLM